MTRRYTQGLKIEEVLTAIDKASPVDRLGFNQFFDVQVMKRWVGVKNHLLFDNLPDG